MAPQSVVELCEAVAAVCAEDAHVLSSVAPRLPLLADIAGADIALLTPTREGDSAVVLAEGQPTVHRPLYRRSRVGELLTHAAEPLIARGIATGKTQRSRHPVLLAGRPVEQIVIAVAGASSGVAGVCSVERSILDGPWLKAPRVLREAAQALADGLTAGAIDARGMLCILRMARGLAIVESTGQIAYADADARRAWREVQPGAPARDRLPTGVPPEATAISRAHGDWGEEWEFEAGGAVFRRRNIALEPGRLETRTLVTIHNVSHLHAGQWLVSGPSAAAQEIHHRVKNNLQTISSLLRMQARREESPQARESLHTAIGRVQSVAFVHEALSLDGVDEVDLKALASTLAEAAVDGRRSSQEIAWTVVGPRLVAAANRASQIALVLNELIQNTVKHAFPQDGGALVIRFDQTPEGTRIAVEDDGVGLPNGFDLRRTSSLGLQLARQTAESDLDGTLTMSTNGGTTSVLTLPAPIATERVEDS